MSDYVTEDEAASLVDDALDDAIEGMSEAVEAYTFDGDRGETDHASGEPVRRGLVLGDDDPRDAEIHELVQAEETVWQGRIFDVNRLGVQLPDGRAAQRDVVRHPGAVAIVALTDDGRICLVRQYRAALGRVTVEVPAGVVTGRELTIRLHLPDAISPAEMGTNESDARVLGLSMMSMTIRKK